MGAPSNRTATLESQMIPMIQDVPGQTLSAALSGITYSGNGSNTLTLSVVDSGQVNTAFKTVSVTVPPSGSPTVKITESSGAISNAGLIDVMGSTTFSSDSLTNSITTNNGIINGTIK